MAGNGTPIQALQGGDLVLRSLLHQRVKQQTGVTPLGLRPARITDLVKRLNRRPQDLADPQLVSPQLEIAVVLVSRGAFFQIGKVGVVRGICYPAEFRQNRATDNLAEEGAKTSPRSRRGAGEG